MHTLGHEDIRWLDISMHNPLGVGSIERICDLNSQRQNRLHLHGLARDSVLQRHSIEKFHHDE
jgi:hypothetical protein